MGAPLIPAMLSGDALLRQIEECRQQASDDAFDIWWLGQSGFLIQWNGYCLLLDPYLSDSLTVKYATTDKPHVRMSERVIDPAILKGIDIVTSSHNHTDHLDAETLIPLMANNPDMRFLIPEANRGFVCDRLKCADSHPVGISDGERVAIHPFMFHGIPAAHNEIERDDAGRCKFMGYVVTFGPFSIYHSGDTLLFPGLDNLLKPFKVDLALLPINGNLPARRVAGNMNAEEAATLAHAIGARLVIPHHYNMFEFNTADPQHFAAAARRLEQPFTIPAHGERVHIETRR
jgi:L-ascorbate metabolism protein UlaG (beta-lactamase superfamily)